MSKVESFYEYSNGAVEIWGFDALSGRFVLRYVDCNMKIMEWHETKENWVKLDDGSYKNYRDIYSKQFEVLMGGNYGNVLELLK